MIEQREAKLVALQQAITEGIESGITEDFSMEALQKELDKVQCCLIASAEKQKTAAVKRGSRKR